MSTSDNHAELVIPHARPTFLANEKDGMYWQSESQASLILVFENKSAVEALYHQIGRVMGWVEDTSTDDD